ncbi:MULTISPECIES: HAD family hydrolase [Myroides]|uniref:HAD family hydrolase n=1 Tax=Myroides albus TaxID=2562892 RepID=A0A6I3LHU6_9FLAO|nr:MULTISPECIES: HAD family hydrolase [Myroides]MTG97417.1 HAD family hydrolase [Myroides albus]MVX34529.1 HAD family hydrolase [Myroides sp. LoEW2-1]UVD79446.1 HAD family hydrolase [Myroides albus]
MSNRIKTIAFDADDTLWDNEIYYQQTEQAFCELLKDFLPKEDTSRVLFETEMRNLSRYGFGAKSFLLSLLETAMQITQRKMNDVLMQQILDLGHALIDKPITLLDGVQETMEILSKDYTLILATKGDLLDQERKLKNSNLGKYFDHVEVMSDKQTEDYHKLIDKLNITAPAFMMVGNSVKSDIIPVLEIGANALHIPFHVTWAHEVVEAVDHKGYYKLDNIREVVDFLK